MVRLFYFVLRLCGDHIIIVCALPFQSCDLKSKVQASTNQMNLGRYRFIQEYI